MKLAFLSLIVLLITAPVQAQVYKEFPDPAVKRTPPTQKQIDEAFSVSDNCKAADTVRNYYDCDCLSANFLELRTRNPDAKQDNLITAARKQCANMTGIAGDSYNRCLSWATTTRDDFERYCSCYANTFAKTFAKGPTDSIRGREMQMTYALNQCSTGNEIQQDLARQRAVEQLKNQGVYDRLFPGAAQTP